MLNYLCIKYTPPPVQSCLLRSRAATAFFAIRLRSATDSFSALALPPLLAILHKSRKGINDAQPETERHNHPNR